MCSYYPKTHNFLMRLSSYVLLEDISYWTAKRLNLQEQSERKCTHTIAASRDKGNIRKLLNKTLAVVHKLSRVARASWPSIKGLCWCANWRNTPLRLNSTVLHLICACTPKVLRYTRLFNCSALNSQTFWRFIHCNDWSGLSTASKTTSALLQIRFDHVND